VGELAGSRNCHKGGKTATNAPAFLQESGNLEQARKRRQRFFVYKGLQALEMPKLSDR